MSGALSRFLEALNEWSGQRFVMRLFTSIFGKTSSKSLRFQVKKYQKRKNGKKTRVAIKNAVSIDKRPRDVDEMKRVGDWKIDTAIGKNHKGAIVTIVEKKTRLLSAALVSSKHAEPVTSTTLTLLTPFKGRLHTMLRITERDLLT